MCQKSSNFFLSHPTYLLKEWDFLKRFSSMEPPSSLPWRLWDMSTTSPPTNHSLWRFKIAKASKYWVLYKTINALISITDAWVRESEANLLIGGTMHTSHVCALKLFLFFPITKSKILTFYLHTQNLHELILLNKIYYASLFFCTHTASHKKPTI